MDEDATEVKGECVYVYEAMAMITHVLSKRFTCLRSVREE